MLCIPFYSSVSLELKAFFCCKHQLSNRPVSKVTTHYWDIAWRGYKTPLKESFLIFALLTWSPLYAHSLTWCARKGFRTIDRWWFHIQQRAVIQATVGFLF